MAVTMDIEIAALQIENMKLQSTLEIANVERQVVQQALDEILKANIAVQTNFVLAENAKNALQAQVNELKKTVNDLMQQLADLKKDEPELSNSDLA